MIKLAPGFPGVVQAAHKDQEKILPHKGSQNHSKRDITFLMCYSQPVDENPTYYIWNEGKRLRR